MKKILFSLLLTLALVFGLTSCGKKDNGTYTMHDFLSSTASLKWNPLTWETNDDSSVLGYLSMGFYDYRVDVDKKGNSLGKYVVVPEMAAELPEDVTASYAGQYGVTEGQKNKAFRIKLNKKATWNDGTPITADDYIYSMQQQLDPAQLNRRADSYYGGDFSFVNAQAYLYSGRIAKLSVKDAADAEARIAAGEAVYVDAWAFWGAKGYKDAQGNECPQYVAVNSTVAYNDYNPDSEHYMDDEFTGAALWDYFKVGGQYETKAGQGYVFYDFQYDTTTWDQVGLKKIDEYTIDIIIENELENPNFYLPYYLSSTWLVKKDLYEACWTETADKQRVNTYGTSVETTASYGPYILTSYEADKQLKFAKNENWYGWTDKAHVVNGKRLYQTTNIQIDVISTHETQLLAFKKGQIDAVGLQAADLEEFGNSQYKMLTPQSYTTKLTFNTDKASLEGRQTAGINKVMLTNQKFRKAMSLSFDRSAFCTEFTAGHTAGFGIFNYMYQFFGSDGLSSSYRDSDAAKDALCRVYGLEYGKGKDFATLDEAYKAITGYNPTAAHQLLVEAIAEAKADGTWNGTDKVSLQFSVYQDDEVYRNMFNFFDTALKAIAKGTELEGKIELTMNVDADYYESMYAGKTDIIFSTWGGATYGTFGMLSNVYVDDYTGEGNQMEIGFNSALVQVKFKLNDTIGEKTLSLKAWADWLNAKDNETGEDVAALGKASNIAPEKRAELLAELEYQYLNQFVTTPIYYRQTVSLRSMKINYPTDEYIDLVGFGGLSQITYNYDDAEWDAYVASQGGELKY